MKRTLLAALVLVGAIATASSAAEFQVKSKESVDAAYAVGCLSEEDGKWMLIHATDAVVTEISPLTPDEEKAADALETPGDNRYHLIGVERDRLREFFLLAGHHFKPKGERVYDHSEYLSGMLNAYNYGLAGEQPNLTLQVSFFKDGEKRGQIEEKPFAAQVLQMALTTFDIPLNVSNFKEPGDYTIEITVTDHIKNEKLTETIAFVIEE